MSLQVEKTLVEKAGGCTACGSSDRKPGDVVYQVWMGPHTCSVLTIRLCPECMKELVEQAPMRMGIGK